MEEQQEEKVLTRKLETLAPSERKKVPLKPGHGLFQWMRIVQSGKNLSGIPAPRKVTLEEVSRHCTPDDCWIILRGKVYNVSKYMDYHPGGVEELLRGAGRDCTDLFNDYHMWVNADGFLKTCFVGTLVTGAYMSTSVSSPFARPGAARGGMLGAPAGGGGQFKKTTIVELTQINYNTKLFKLKLESPDTIALGQHVKLKADRQGGKVLLRPYTPIHLVKETGFMDFIIKIYSNGVFTRYLNTLKEGDTILYSKVKNSFYDIMEAPPKQLGMICGGTGITPILRVIREFHARKDELEVIPEMTLVFGNSYEKDILMREELDGYKTSLPGFNVVYCLSKPEEDWEGEKGRVDDTLMKKYMPATDTKDYKILVCGPILMTNSTIASLRKLGHHGQALHAFV